MSNSFKLFLSNIAKGTAVVGTIAVLVGCTLNASKDSLPTEQTATVYRCDNANSTVYCETADGNEWAFEGYGYEVGETITIVIDDGCVVNAIN